MPPARADAVPAAALAGAPSRGGHEILAHRGLLRALVIRDFVGRYRGSSLNQAWALLEPAILIGIYTYVFAVVLRVRVGEGVDASSFALHLVCGLLPWKTFSESAARAVQTLSDRAHHVRRVHFPLELLPLEVTLSPVLGLAVAFAVLTPLLWATGHGPGIELLWLPVLLAAQAVFTAGIAWALASLGVFLPDLRQIVPLALLAGFFLTPIVYPPERIPDSAALLYYANPFAWLVTAYRRVLLEGGGPGPLFWFAFVPLAALSAAVGRRIFRAARPSFAEVL